MRELWGEPLAKDSDRVMRPYSSEGMLADEIMVTSTPYLPLCLMVPGVLATFRIQCKSFVR